MPDENIVQPVTTNEPVEPVAPDPQDPATTPTEPQLPADPEQLKAINKKLFERAKTAEAEAKRLRGGAAPTATALNSLQPSVEETVLLANGMPEELLKELKTVAKVRGMASLLKAQNDPIFVAVKEKFEKDKKHKDASLAASRGAGGVAPQKSFNTPGLSREEHRKMVLEGR